MRHHVGNFKFACEEAKRAYIYLSLFTTKVAQNQIMIIRKAQ